MLQHANEFCQVLFLLVCGHAVADRPLQTELMRQEKNRLKGSMWPYGLMNHGLVHGGFVALITGMWWLGVCEAVAHAIIDDAKCTKKIGLKADQLLHLCCKVLWVGVLFYVK